MKHSNTDHLTQILSTIDLIAIDIDGTLLDSEGVIPDGARATIEKARVHSILVAIVTSRNRIGLLQVMESLGMQLPYICSGGAHIANPETDEVIKEIPLRQEIIEQIVPLARQAEAAIFIEAHGRIYAEAKPEVIVAIKPLKQIDVFLTDDILHAYEGDPQKIVMVNNHETLVGLEAKIRADVKSVYLSYSSPIYLEVTEQEANKGDALRHLANYFGIPLSHVAAIGDENNDLSMFEVAGLAIAMGNAAPEIQAAADLIAPSNDNGGVIWAIDRILSARLKTSTKKF